MYADSGGRGAHKRVDRERLQQHIAAQPRDIAKRPAGLGLEGLANWGNY